MILCGGKQNTEHMLLILFVCTIREWPWINTENQTHIHFDDYNEIINFVLIKINNCVCVLWLGKFSFGYDTYVTIL